MKNKNQRGEKEERGTTVRVEGVRLKSIIKSCVAFGILKGNVVLELKFLWRKK